MLRAAVALLLLANLAFFGWTAGWLTPWLLAAPAGDAAQREPQRLQAQLRPEAITVVGEAEARRLAAALCLQLGPLDAAQLAKAQAATEGAGLPAAQFKSLAVDGAWLLRLPEASVDQQITLRNLTDPALGAGFAPCP